MRKTMKAARSMAAALMLLSPMLAIGPTAAVAQSPALGSDEDLFQAVRSIAATTRNGKLRDDGEADRIVFLRKTPGESIRIFGVVAKAAGGFLPRSVIDTISGPTAVLIVRDRRDRFQNVRLEDYPSVEEPHDLRIFVATGTSPQQRIWELSSQAGFEQRELDDKGAPGKWDAWPQR